MHIAFYTALALTYLICAANYIPWNMSFFDIDEPSADEWVRQVVIFRLLTNSGKPNWLRSLLDSLWGLFHFFGWILILPFDLLLKGWYRLNR